MTKKPYDEVGPWTEIKLEILEKYAPAYSRLVKDKGFYHLYIDGFAGSGKHISRTTGEEIAGSPSKALDVDPPFDEYHFIDLDAQKVCELEKAAKDRTDVFVHRGDCNEILLKEVFQKVRYNEYRRALCLLDPYSLQLNWDVIKAAGKSGSIEIFLNFPILDINRNVLRRDKSKRIATKVASMTAFWGDDSWEHAAFKKARQMNFLDAKAEDKVSNEKLSEAFRKRLEEEAGFKYVPRPMAMVNRTNNVVYYLYFASPNQTGGKIVNDIFKKYGYCGGK